MVRFSFPSDSAAAESGAKFLTVRYIECCMPLTVFLSSTYHDLIDYRKEAQKAITNRGCLVKWMEDFPATEEVPLAECYRRIDQSDVVFVIVAHRYGWIPPDQPEGANKSITWLECEYALSKGKHVLGFVMDPSHEPWPSEKKEGGNLMALMDSMDPEEFAKYAAAAPMRKNLLGQFKKWLGPDRTLCSFTNPADLRDKVKETLDWYLTRNSPGATVTSPAPTGPDPAESAYLAALHRRTGQVQITKFHPSSKSIPLLPIDDLYVPLHTAGRLREPATKDKQERQRAEEQKGIRLKAATILDSEEAPRCVLIEGDPGSGKSMFLQRLAHALSRPEADPAMPLARRGFPLYARINELYDHIQKHRGGKGDPDAPASLADSVWIPHFLACSDNPDARERRHLLTVLHRRMRGAETIVLLDGLDEAPGQTAREEIVKLIRHIESECPCSVLVTSRREAVTGISMEYRLVIGPLESDSVALFVKQWSTLLFESDPEAAAGHARDLKGALRNREDIGEFIRNPLALTAIAVVYWNYKRLPDHIADLYEQILWWMAHQREATARERPGAQECLKQLGELAWHMQTVAGGRQRALNRVRAAEALGGDDAAKWADFFESEQVDSGIVVGRDAKVEFRHLQFQEYLAARRLSMRRESEITGEVARRERLIDPEWRQTLRLFFGRLVLANGQEDFARALLDDMVGKLDGSLELRARCVDLVGSILVRLPKFEFESAEWTSRIRAMRELFEVTEENLKLPPRLRAAAAEVADRIDPSRLRKPSDDDYWLRVEPPAVVELGDEDGSGETEKPRQAKLRPFWIGRAPVTVFEYSDFVKKGHPPPPDWVAQLRTPSRPVVNVTYEARAYATSIPGGRLLSSDEWEFAARGTERRKYPWGTDEPDASRANYDQTGVGAPTPVGLFPLGATPEGLVDMGGNAWEEISTDYPGVNVAPGGSFHSIERSLRCSYRIRNVPDLGYRDQGFRCARE